jgi:hypothetical protein
MHVLRLCAAAVFLSWAGPAWARFALDIDVSQATAVLDALERGDTTAADAIVAMRPTQELISHHAPFSDQITASSWRESLVEAISGASRRDIYGLARLSEQAGAVRASIATIQADPEQFARDVEAIVAPYAPPDVQFDVTLWFVVGVPGSGWTDNPNEFFFDIGRAAGDLEGAKVVCAHELYHLVLARLLPAPRLAEDSRLGRAERALLTGINEGMATHVGRFGRGDTGAVSRTNLGFEQTNIRRLQNNFRLVDALLLAATRSDAVSADDIDSIAFSGLYSEPGYYVFREMAARIEEARGRDALVALLHEPPSRFVLTYHEVADADDPTLQPDTLRIVRELDRRLARR